MDYFDILLAKKLEDDRDPKVEGLSVNANGRYHEDGVVYDPVIVNVPETPLSKLTVTENGTYTAPSGTAYNEVEVDVPLPENAYLLKDIPNTPTAIATFSDASALPMPKLEVAIEPVQDLHGYDAPWVGGSGKNKFQTIATSKTEGGVTWTVNSDGTVTVSGTATGYSSLALGEARVNSSMGNIVISGVGGTTNIAWGGVELRDSNDNVLLVVANGGTYAYFTVDLSQYPTAYKITMSVKRNNNGAVSGVIKPQVELGQSVTTYEQYSNICPISGWDEVDINVSGVNVWDEEWEQGYYDANGNKNNVQNAIRSKNHIPCLPNTTYYIHNGTDSNGRIQFYDASKNWIGTSTGIMNNTVTTPNNCYYINISTGTTYGGTYNNDISINYPSTDTSYHAYNGHTYTIDLDGTRYGGKLDVVSGVLTVTHKSLNLGDQTWGMADSSGGVNRFYVELNDMKSMPIRSMDVLCSCYKTNVGGGVFDDSTIYNTPTPTRIMINTSQYSDVTALKNSLSGQVALYELATPLTIQLTTTVVKSLRGMNNVWADSGNILDLSYLAKEE